MKRGRRLRRSYCCSRLTRSENNRHRLRFRRGFGNTPSSAADYIAEAAVVAEAAVRPEIEKGLVAAEHPVVPSDTMATP